MSFIKVELGGKKIGIADQASIEPAKGCNNGCVGCYAAKTTRMGGRFNNMQIKEFDKDVFIKSCKSAYNKGIRYVRMAKHCDAGDPALRRIVYQILEEATKNKLKIVFVTKSLEVDEKIIYDMIVGGHILHYSLGMDTNICNEDRIKAAKRYGAAGVNCFMRICEDVTKPISSIYRGYIDNKIIVTPMRYSSKDHAKHYHVNLDNYEFVGGYYRPKFIHESWLPYSNWCGEVGKKVLCSNCMVNEA